MKIKYFEVNDSDKYKELEDNVNHFIKNKEVIDIKYQRNVGGYGHWLSVLILYEVKKK